MKDGQSFCTRWITDIRRARIVNQDSNLGIPILGALFSHTLLTALKTELIIVATVNLVDPVGAEEQVSCRALGRTSDLNDS
ncbi:hypothetical protein OK016_24325 [Vibrio chagasii]|nr:hypothetical protein [Vibrio chagasii]